MAKPVAVQGHALDPHDPESFGFAFVGEVTGAHGARPGHYFAYFAYFAIRLISSCLQGVHGDVRVRADDFLCDQGAVFPVVLQSNQVLQATILQRIWPA